jgi:hypothetical protein
MLPQILSADPLPPAGVATLDGRWSVRMQLLVFVTVLAAAYRNQHRTARVAALGTLFIWHRITLLSGMQKPPKVTLAAVLVSISCYYYNTGGMYQTRPFFICQAKAPVLFGAF